MKTMLLNPCFFACYISVLLLYEYEFESIYLVEDSSKGEQNAEYFFSDDCEK